VLGDGDALRAGLHQLRVFPIEERRSLLVRRLTTDDAPVRRAADKLAHDVGYALGRSVLERDHGERTSVRDLVDEWLSNRPTAGPLSNDHDYLEWLEGLGYGAKDATEQAALPPTAIGDFAEVMTAIWKQRSGLPPEEGPDAAGRFAICAFYPAVGDRIGKSSVPQETWWRALRPLATAVVRDGRPRDISELVFPLRVKATIERLGSMTFEPLVDALSARVAREKPATLIGPVNSMDSWPFILGYASDLLGNVAALSMNDRRLVSKIHGVLQKWASLGVERAIEVAQFVRGLTRGGTLG
jgi:hypothetical protein